MAQKMCGVCDFCHEEHPNSFVTAANCASPTLTGVTVDGAHAEYIAVDAGGTVLIPDGVSDEQAAPIICAGYTVWSGLRRAEPQTGRADRRVRCGRSRAPRDPVCEGRRIPRHRGDPQPSESFRLWAASHGNR
jgi:hypothetical protein